MAITKLVSATTPNPVSAGAGGDWEKAMAQLTAVKKLLSGEQMILTQWTNTTTAPALAEGSYLQHMGAIYVVDTEDYALPALSSDGTYYIRIAVNGETLSVSYTTNIADYEWSAQHNGLYHADGSQVLHYQVVKNASAIEKYKMLNPWQVNDFAVVNYLGRYHGRELHVTGNATIGGAASIGGALDVTGAINGATVNTGQGANELYAMNQNVRTTDSPTFATVNATKVITTEGPNPPIDNNDDTPPAIGVGGFTYVIANIQTGFDLPSGGTYVVIYASGSGTGRSDILRLAGGGHVTAGSISGSYKFLVMRIA